MKRWISGCLLLLAGCSSGTMTAPAGKLSAEVFITENGSLAYTVSYNGRMVCDTSSMGVTIDGSDTFEEVSIRLAASRERDESYPVRGVHDLARDHAREYVWQVTHRPTGYVYTLETRLYDDGFAYRFILPGQGVRHIGGEAAACRQPGLVCRAELGVETADLCR